MVMIIGKIKDDFNKTSSRRNVVTEGELTSVPNNLP